VPRLALVPQPSLPPQPTAALSAGRPLPGGQPSQAGRRGADRSATPSAAAGSAAAALPQAQGNHTPAAGSGPPGAVVAAAAGSARPRQADGPLQRRLLQWPAWTLPAPLPRPGRQAPRWPGWFAGEWRVESTTLSGDPAEPAPANPAWLARFCADGHGGALADRAFNAGSLGSSLLGKALLSVQDDPANPLRQLTRLANDQLLETTLVGQRGETPTPELFLNDELSLQVLHGPGDPRVSRVESLGRWRLQPDGSIAGEQWQARYASPAAGLGGPALATERLRIRLVPVPPGSDRARQTAAPALDCR